MSARARVRIGVERQSLARRLLSMHGSSIRRPSEKALDSLTRIANDSPPTNVTTRPTNLADRRLFLFTAGYGNHFHADRVTHRPPYRRGARTFCSTRAPVGAKEGGPPNHCRVANLQYPMAGDWIRYGSTRCAAFGDLGYRAEWTQRQSAPVCCAFPSANRIKGKRKGTVKCYAAAVTSDGPSPSYVCVHGPFQPSD